MKDKDIQSEKLNETEEVAFDPEIAYKAEILDDIDVDDIELEAEIKEAQEPPQQLDAQKHFYCLQVKYKQGSKEDEIIINRVAMMVAESMKEQTGCLHGMDHIITENTFLLATAVASKNEDFFAKALYCKYEKYPIGVMIGNYNSVLKIAISPTLYIQPKYRTDELICKLTDTFKYWAINTKKADKALLEVLKVI